MSETTLKPCSCGREAKITGYDYGYGIREYTVFCRCGREIKFFLSKEKAIEAWNRRDGEQ